MVCCPGRTTRQRQGTGPVIARVRPTGAAHEDHRSRSMPPRSQARPRTRRSRVSARPSPQSESQQPIPPACLASCSSLHGSGLRPERACEMQRRRRRCPTTRGRAHSIAFKTVGRRHPWCAPNIGPSAAAPQLAVTGQPGGHVQADPSARQQPTNSECRARMSSSCRSPPRSDRRLWRAS